MPELSAIVVDIPSDLDRLGPTEVWQEMADAMPEAFAPLADLLGERAPRDSGRLAGSSFTVETRRRSAGLIQGIDVSVGSGDPIAHLVAEGHAIIPRGPDRAAIAAAPRGTKREKRAEFRENVKARRAAGPIGFVPGNPWVEMSFAEQRGNIVAAVEAQLERAFGR